MVEMTLSIIVVSLPGLKPLLGGSRGSVNGSTDTAVNESEQYPEAQYPEERYTEKPKSHV